MPRTFPTEVLLSLTTGRLLCEFSKMHELAEWLCGSPVFTHQFAYRPFVDELRDCVIKQHPSLDINGDAVTTENWQEFRDKQLAALGPQFELVAMTHTGQHSADSFSKPLEGKNVIVLDEEAQRG